MVGLFLDHGGGARFGSRFAARQIRYASAEHSKPLPPDVLARCVDLGDLNVFPLEPERQEAAFRRQIGAIASTGAIPVIVGGRHFDAPLGAYAGLKSTVTLAEADTPGRLQPRTALSIGLDGALTWSAAPGAFGRFVGAISRLPADQVGAVHIAGIVPGLDVDGRHVADFAAGILDATVRMLAGVRPCH